MATTPLIGIIGGAIAGSLCAGVLVVTLSPGENGGERSLAVNQDSTTLDALQKQLREMQTQLEKLSKSKG